MKKQLISFLDNSITFLLLVVAGLTPLLFLNQTTEFYEMPKLVFLIVSTIVILGLWIFSWIVKGKMQITRTPLDIPLLLLAGVILISTFFSVSKFSSIYGNFPRVHGTAVSWVTYILLYFVTVSNLKSLGKIKTFLYVLFASGVIVALISLLSFFNIYLPFDFAKAANFTPTGSTFSTVAFLMLLLPLPLLSVINNNKYMPAPVGLALSILFGATIALIGAVPSYVALLIVFVLCFLVGKPHHAKKYKKMLPMFLTPVVVVILALTLAYLPFPGNKLQTLESRFPKEIQLPFSISWKISASAFRDAPYIGTGPSTYLFNFTSYKPLEFNTLNYWNFSFDAAYNEFLQILGTMGIVGLIALTLVCLVVINSARKFLSLNETESDDNNIITSGLAISAILGIVLLAIHATTMVSIVMTLFAFGVLMVSQKHIREKVMNVSMGIKASTLDDKQFDLFPVIIFAVFLIGAAYVLFNTYNATMADYYHRQALVQASKSGTATYTNLQKAESLNPTVDLYRVDMAQTNFALANAIAVKKGPSKEDPKGTLTDQDKRTIQTLLSQSINEGRVAVALNPLSSRNWVVLASIYRNVSGIAQNALAFSLDSYGRAIQRDPLNPELRLNVGGVYYTGKNYDSAIRFFSDAANLKPNYTNAYFNLAIALRDKGDLQNAKLVADQVLSLSQKNGQTQDVQIANALVKDIADKIAAAAKNAPAAETPKEATVQQNGSALQNPNLQGQGVNVNGLNNPPAKVTTPNAVKQNPSTNIPKLSPTASPAPSSAVTPTP